MEQVEEAESGKLILHHRLPNHVFYDMKHPRQKVTLKKIKGVYDQILIVWRILIGLPSQRRSNISK